MVANVTFASFIENDESAGADVVSPTLFVRPAIAELLGRLASLPVLATQTGIQLLLGRRSLIASVERLGRALPTGCSATARSRRACKRCSPPLGAATTSGV